MLREGWREKRGGESVMALTLPSQGGGEIQYRIIGRAQVQYTAIVQGTVQSRPVRYTPLASQLADEGKGRG